MSIRILVNKAQSVTVPGLTGDVTFVDKGKAADLAFLPGQMTDTFVIGTDFELEGKSWRVLAIAQEPSRPIVAHLELTTNG